MAPPSLQELRRDDRWFAALHKERQASILRRAQISSVRAGARIYQIGDDPNGLHRILSGEVRLVSYPTPGEIFTSLTIRAGRWFGELSVLDQGPRPHDAIATKDTRFLSLTMGAVKSMAEEDPMIYRDIALIMCRHQRSSLQFITDRRSRSLRTRVAQVLINSLDGGKTEIGITQADLGARLSISRQSINKVLRRLEGEGALTRAYGKLIVKDPKILTRALRTAPRDLDQG